MSTLFWLHKVTSIIFSSSPKYKEDLAKSKSEKKLPKVEVTEAFMPDDTLTDSNSNWGVVNVDRAEEPSVEQQQRITSRAPSQYSESKALLFETVVLKLH